MSDVRPSPSARVLRRGVAFGLGAGLMGGVAWFLVVLGTASMTTYLIPALGVAVAYGVHLGMHRPGRTAAASVVRHAFHKSPAAAVYSLVALVAGGWFGFKGFTADEHEHARLAARADSATPVARGN